MGAAQQAGPFPGATSSGPGVVATADNYTKGATWDGGVSTPDPASVKIVRCLPCQYSGTIVSATVESDVAGSATVEVWKTDYAGAPATASNKISGAAPITLASSAKNHDTTLTGWSLNVVVGDILAFKLATAATLKWLTAGVEIKPT